MNIKYIYKRGKNWLRRLYQQQKKGVVGKKIMEYRKIQNKRIVEQYSKSIENLIVFLVPEMDAIGGGVMSICSIAQVTKEMKEIHHSEVLICTVPNKNTFPNYTKFKTEFDIFRFGQLKKHFKHLNKLMIHIPEIYVERFYQHINFLDKKWLCQIKDLTINIMNQNDELMPRPSIIERCRNITPNMTMTCAHRQYCTPQMRSSYTMPVHLLLASNLVKYEYKAYDKKKNRLVYSPDLHPLKEKILDRIRTEMPELEMVMIQNMTYSDYRKIIGESKFMITFGEGLDGYFSESIRSGTLAFAAYNSVFFNERFKDLPIIYDSYHQMANDIVADMKKLDNESIYNELNKKLRGIDALEYNDRDYIENIRKYYLKEYTFPIEWLIEERQKRLEKKPLVSIVVATLNGEKYLKKQLESLNNLTYENKEIIISDDGSIDDTISIIEEFGQKSKITFVKNRKQHGINGNFSNAIQYAKGEYIALCDQDDIWLPDKLEQLVEHIDDFDLIHGGVLVIDENDSIHPDQAIQQLYVVDKTKQYHFTDYIKTNHALGCTMLIRTSFLKRIMPIPSDAIFHDWWIVLCAIKKSGIVFLDQPVIQYRQHHTNTAKTTYQDYLWLTKKQKLNNLVLSKMKDQLTNQEQKMIHLDSNWCKYQDLIRQYMPNSVDLFFEKNYLSVTDEMLHQFKMDAK